METQGEPQKEVKMMLSPKIHKIFEIIKRDYMMDDDSTLHYLLEYHAERNMRKFLKAYENDPSQAKRVQEAKESIEGIEIIRFVREQKLKEMKNGEPEGHLYVMTSSDY